MDGGVGVVVVTVVVDGAVVAVVVCFAATKDCFTRSTASSPSLACITSAPYRRNNKDIIFRFTAESSTNNTLLPVRLDTAVGVVAVVAAEAVGEDEGLDVDKGRGGRGTVAGINTGSEGRRRDDRDEEEEEEDKGEGDTFRTTPLRSLMLSLMLLML